MTIHDAFAQLIAIQQLIAKGRFAVALEEVDGFLQRHPDDLIALHNRCTAEYFLGKYDAALVTCDRIIEAYPRDARAWSKRAVCMADSGRSEDAVPDFHRALELDPSDTTTRLELGKTLARLHRHREAIAQFTEAIAIQDEADAWRYLGRSLEAEGRFEDALSCLNASLARNPDSSGIWVDRGALLANRGSRILQAASGDLAMAVLMIRAAIRDFDRALQLDPNMTLAKDNLDQIEIYLDDTERIRPIEAPRTGPFGEPGDSNPGFGTVSFGTVSLGTRDPRSQHVIGDT